MFLLVFFSRHLSSNERAGLNEDSNSDLSDAAAVLNQLNYQANWEPAAMWVDEKFGCLLRTLQKRNTKY